MRFIHNPTWNKIENEAASHPIVQLIFTGECIKKQSNTSNEIFDNTKIEKTYIYNI